MWKTDRTARKAKVLGSNADAATKFGTTIDAISTDLRKGLKQLHHVQHNFGKGLQADLGELTRRGGEVSTMDRAIARHELIDQTSQRDMAAIDAALLTFGNSAESLSTSIQRGEVDAAEAGRSLLAAKNSVQRSVREWAQAVSDRSTKVVDDVLEHQQGHLSTVSSVLASTADLVDNVISATRAHLSAEAEAAERSKASAHQIAAAEIVRLRGQNDLLARMLSDEKAKTARLRTELVQNLTNLIHGFTDAQDESWTHAVEGIKVGNEAGMGDMERYGDLVEQESEARRRRTDSVEQDLEEVHGSAKRQRTEGINVSRQLVLCLWSIR